MSNTLANLKDIKVAQRALMPFMANLLPVTAFSTNFGPQPSDKGDTVRVPLVGAPTDSSDFAGDYTANADSTVTTVPVTLNRHKFKTVHVTARENSETAMDVLDTLVEVAAQQLAQDVLLDIMTVITLANFGAPAIAALAATSFDYKKVLSVRDVCGQAKMPASQRSLVLDSGFYTNLLADDVVAKSFNLNLSAPGVTEALIKRLAGFDLFETIVIPAAHAEKLVGFAAHPSAIAVAMRYLQPVADYQQAGAVTDPQTGMTFGYLRFTDRLQRDGWKLLRHESPSAEERVVVFEKTLPCGWILEKTAHATSNSPVGSGCYFDTHRLLHPESGEILNHPEWEWAELDRKRLVWVSKGVLYAAKIHGKGLGDSKALHDFNEMAFEAIAAPY